jgi:hypothetical protein
MPATLPRPPSALAFIARPPPARAQRRLAFAALGLLVLMGHRWLLGALGAWVAQPAAPALPVTSAVQVWLMPTPAPTAATASTAKAPTPAARRAQTSSPTLPRVAKAAADAAPHRAHRETGQPSPTAPTVHDEGASALTTATPPPPAPTPTDDGAAAAPPTYPTRPPPPARLHFAVQRGEQQGQAEWLWQHDGLHFVSHLQSALPGRSPLDHQTRGEFDGAGLAPVRMLESQRGRAVRAVNFQRDKGLVSFSGSARQWALWPGAQDRASWLPQLLAVVAARNAWTPGQQIELAVASPRGELDRWAFTQVDDLGPDAGQRGAALHWVREPLRPYDSRVDVWLDRSAPHWPLALQWQVLPGGEPLRWRLSGAPETAPAP